MLAHARRAASTTSSPGLTLRDDARRADRRTRVTAVRFRPLDDAAIAEYVARGRVARPRRWATRSRRRAPRSSSGIEGDFFNVVGLPVALLVEMLSERRRPVSG